ncbi:unnamed protein product [Cunninghamella blakesleeana]
MDSQKILTNTIYWVRMMILVLSVLIMIASLSQYSQDTIPLLTLIHNINDQTYANSIRESIIQDRKLIATLVASQVSIFCPLFLLAGSQTEKIKKLTFYYIKNNEQQQQKSKVDEKMSLLNNNNNNVDDHDTSPFLKGCLDIFCQFLMSIGLAITWIFCISFDQKVEAIDSSFSMTTDSSSSSSTTLSTSSSMSSVLSFIWDLCSISNKNIYELKFVILFILMVEMYIQ